MHLICTGFHPVQHFRLVHRMVQKLAVVAWFVEGEDAPRFGCEQAVCEMSVDERPIVAVVGFSIQKSTILRERQ